MGKLKKEKGNGQLDTTGMRIAFGFHPTRAERYQQGKELRDKCPREGHAAWKPAAGRPDPVSLLEESSKGRISELIPIRYGRMMKSPFIFYRGAAFNMASDLARTPVSGLRVQACGDCHLCNFGCFATPERRVIFDINDLDETLPAPWEWDLKRLTTSFVLACRDNGFSEDTARDTALACARSYRERMLECSEMRALDVWYASMDVESLMGLLEEEEARQRFGRRLAKARERSVAEHDFPEMVHAAGPTPTIRDNPPLIYHWREKGYEEMMTTVRKAFGDYRDTLAEHKRVLLDRFKLMDLAIKVVGVGSVGTRCFVILLMAADNDPLFLQVKEARASVLEPFAGKSLHANHGQRVVVGCHLMQSASDMFLGWTEGQQGRHFYIRQLRDMKLKPLVEIFTQSVMRQYAEFCGWCLARSHARSTDPALMSGYMGKGDALDEAIADFSVAYADQSERDHEALMKAIRAGKLEIFIERD
ncbi:MAG: DUF2252 domain-containing protein [Gemmataceae bacterium]